MRYAGLLAIWSYGGWLAGAGASGMDGFAATVGCGPTDRTHVPGGRARCKTALEHDCTSMVTLQKFCPAECPYVAPHPDLSCVFECAPPDWCHQVNAEFAFPNESSKPLAQDGLMSNQLVLQWKSVTRLPSLMRPGRNRVVHLQSFWARTLFEGLFRPHNMI
ncbi:unnamed protein product [Prorocentrum cordatum]|uniref:Uncharacterized protein n=1 Tax=Prorocentrum cordatum TaxID=2364126 RepID=A0ABN9QUC3_9DINO|nr:unnamed protein product [Polarella glacialis]